MRRFLRWLLVLGMAGTLTELFLLGHTEGRWQQLPLGLLAAGLAAVVADVVSPGRLARRGLGLIMALFILSGIVGIYQHIEGNLEFEHELNPARHGGELVWRTLKGATPTLAPGAMIYLGLTGLATMATGDGRPPRIHSSR